MTKKVQNKIISTLLLAVMLITTIAPMISINTAAVGAGMTFSAGFEGLYSADKKMDAMPKTLEATIKVPSSYGDQFWGDIFAWYDDGAENSYAFWDIQATSVENTDLRFLCGTRGGKEMIIKFVGALKDFRGKDVHLAITLDDTTKDIKLYVNGTEWSGNCTFSGNGGTSKADFIDLYFGMDISKVPMATLGGDFRAKMPDSQYAVHHVDNWRYFRGSIYDVTIFSDVRTAAEIAADKNNLPVNADGLLMCFDTSSVSADKTLTDKSGNGFDMKQRYVKPKGMSFSSGLDSLYSASKKVTALPHTYEADVTIPKSAGDQYWGDIFAWYSGAAGEHYFFVDVHAPSSTDLRILAGMRDASGNIIEEVIVKFVGALNDYRGQQVHLSLTLDTQSKALKLYINGVEWKGNPTCSKSGSGVASPEGLLDLCSRLDVTKFVDFSIGGDFRVKMPESQYSVHHVDNWRFFRGLIHEIAIFDDVRTPEEISKDYKEITKDSSLLMWFDVGSYENSTIVPDKSGNGFDLHGSPEWADTKVPVTDFAYSFAVVGDTQVITRDESVTSSDTYSPDYAGNFSKIYDWIMANKDSKNIQFSFHMGDVTDWSKAAEWELAMKNIHKMNGEIPYNIVRGNHDVGSDFIKNYTMDTFKANIVNGEEYGTFDDNTLNTYQTITVGNIKYLMLSLDLGPSKAIIDWANEVVASHPYHNVIISTHSYLHRSGAYMDDPIDCSATQYNPGGKYNGGSYKDANGNSVYWDYRLDKYKNGGDDYLYQDASYMWNNLVKKHKNICMVLCGHEISDQILNVEAVGDHGNKIAQVLIDPQGLDRALQSAGQGHAGLVAMLYFSADGKTVTTEYYSTIRNQYYKEGINNQTFELDVITEPENYNALHVEIEKAELLLREDQYSVEDWADILAAIADAKTKLNLPEDEANAAAEELKAFIESKKTLDRSPIEKAMSTASKYIGKKNNYTEETWNAFVETLNAANITFECSRDQSEIDAAAKSLLDAISSLAPAITTDVQTNVPTSSATEAPTEESTKKKGCSSSLAASSVSIVLVLTLGACILSKRRK